MIGQMMKCAAKAVTVACITMCATTSTLAERPNPETIPFWNDWLDMEWPFARGSIGRHLMWQHTDLNDPKVQAEVRAATARSIASGKIPLWEMAWDESSGKGPGDLQWNQWKHARPQYFQQEFRGNPSKESGYWDSISFCMPYDPADWPEGVTNGTRVDWDTARLLAFAKATGGVGYFAADRYDNVMNWFYTTKEWDYNPRNIDAFAKSIGVAIPGATVLERSEVIHNNYFDQWTDFICKGTATQHTTLQKRLREAGVQHPMVGFQLDFNVTAHRLKGMDLRMMGQMSQRGDVFKRVELQGDGGRTPQDKTLSPSFFGLFACRAPNVLHGAQLCADVTDLYQSLKLVGFKSDKDPETLEFGKKYIRAQWLSVGWWHYAQIDGTLERGLCEVMPHYQQFPNSSAPQDALKLIRDLKPAKPFGLAFYYSVPVERAFEKDYPKTGTLYPMTGGYSANTGGGFAHAAQHDGLPVGYSVSDISLDGLAGHKENYPTGWLTSNVDRMPAEELKKLQAIAPVYDLATIKDWSTIPSPIRFTQGACGYAFEDQRGDTIVVIWRQGRGPNGKDDFVAGNTPLECTVSFIGVADKMYTAQDLFDPTFSRKFSCEKGRGSYSFTLPRWGCSAFKIDMKSPNGK